MRGAGMAEHGAISHVFFGLDPMWVSTVLLLITYATIITEKVNRSIIALLGAGVMILVGVLNRKRRSAGSTSTPSVSSPA